MSLRQWKGWKNFPILSCDVCELGSCRSRAVQSLGPWPHATAPVICIHLEGTAHRVHSQRRWSIMQNTWKQGMRKSQEQLNMAQWGEMGSSVLSRKMICLTFLANHPVVSPLIPRVVGRYVRWGHRSIPLPLYLFPKWEKTQFRKAVNQSLLAGGMLIVLQDNNYRSFS